MNLYPFLCLGGNEVANMDRARTYVGAGLLGPNFNVNDDCDCSHILLEEGESYSLPGLGDTPWSDPGVWASEEFLGIAPERIDLQSPYGRQVSTRVTGGGTVSGLGLRPRVLTFRGIMMASSAEGMAYGDRWLLEVLAGQRCTDGVLEDEALILPACPEETYLPTDQALRRLLGVGVTDGPTFTPMGNFPECKLQQVTFQLTAQESYLFGLEETILAHSVSPGSGSVCGKVDAATWSESTTVISLEGVTDATNITVRGTRTADGACPGDGPSCFEAIIPSLPQDGILTIDGTRRQVRYYDPSSKRESSGLGYLTLTKPFTFADVPPCAEVCICTTVGSGTVRVEVAKVERHF